jgi:hypothetical protein
MYRARIVTAGRSPPGRSGAMKLTNTSRYPDAEVALLVEFAMCEVDHARLAVHVRNASRAYRGRAYDGIPSISTRARDADVDRLVTIGIGSPQSFPCDNVHTRVSWVRVQQSTPTPGEVFRRRRDTSGRVHMERRVISQHGYGGKRSPVLTFESWREALVAVAAHRRASQRGRCGAGRRSSSGGVPRAEADTPSRRDAAPARALASAAGQTSASSRSRSPHHRRPPPHHR